MTDLLLKRLPTFLAPAPIVQLQRCRVRLRRRGGCNFWGLSGKSGVGVTELDIVYSSESSDGSVLFRFGTASEIAEYVASQEALNVNDGVETEDVEEVDDGVVEENIESDDKDVGEDTVEGLADGFGDEILLRKSGVGVAELDIVYSSVLAESCDGSVLFRFGTASEIAEYVASQEALKVNEEVDDGVVEETIESDDKDCGEDTMEGLADGFGDVILLVDDLLKGIQDRPVDLEEKGVDYTLDSSEILSGEQISRDEAGVYCAPCPDIISSVAVEEPSVHEDKDGSLETRNFDVVENISSDEVDIESGFGGKSSTLDITSDCDGDADFECSLEKEIVTVGSNSVFDEKYECGGDHSTSFEDIIIVDEDKDPTALQLDVESSSLQDASHNVEKFIAIKIEQAGIDAADKQQEEWNKEIEDMILQHASDMEQTKYFEYCFCDMHMRS